MQDSDVHINATERLNWNNHKDDPDVHVTTENKSTWNAKYDKPSGGIPLEDLAAALQTAYAYALAGITYDDAVSA